MMSMGKRKNQGAQMVVHSQRERVVAMCAIAIARSLLLLFVEAFTGTLFNAYIHLRDASHPD